MNKNISIISFISFFIVFSPINGSDLDPYLGIINSDSGQVAAKLSRAKVEAANEKILHGKASLDKEFQIALTAGRYDYLRSMPNKKNWLSNMFKSKKTPYVNDLINQKIYPENHSEAGILPLHHAVETAGYHRNKALIADAKKDSTEYKKSMYKVGQMRQTILFLIENGADVNAQNGKGQTALHLSYKNPEPTITGVLLNANANPLIEDNNRKKAFRYLDEGKVKNKQEFNNLKNDYYEVYDTWEKKAEKESRKKLSKIKILPHQELIIDNNVKQNKVTQNSPTTTETASSTTSSDQTSSEKSSNRSRQRKKNTLPQPIKFSSQPNLAPLKIKPRPTSAGTLGIMPKPAVKKTFPADTLIIDTIEINKHMKQVKLTVKPKINNTKNQQAQPIEYLGSSHSRGPAQSYSTSTKPKNSSSTTRKPSNRVHAL